MQGADDGEVPAIERGELVLPESLDQREDARVDRPKPKIRVFGLEGLAPLELGPGRSLRSVGAVEKILEKSEPHLSAKPCATPVVELRQDQDRNHEILASFEQQRGAADVVGIRGVERCEQGARVEHERHV